MPSLHRRRNTSRLLLESGLIVASILLAFALNGWWEARQDRRLAEHALASFEKEIRQNRANLLDVMPYHLELYDLITGLGAAGSVRTFEDVRGLEGFHGFQPAFLTTTAWSTAIATGALNHLDYDLVSDLSAVYTFQERFALHSDARHLLSPTAMADATIAATVFSAEIYLGDTIAGARDLVARYDRILEVLAGGE